MCGLIGVAGKIDYKADKAFQCLLILDGVRGIDSTGMAAVDKGGEVRVVKAIGNPYELLEHRMFKPTLNKSNRVLIGHNRWATQGKVDRKNAHPFDFDGLVGAHNGTLKNYTGLDDYRYFDVDSENLLYHIEQHGVKDALSKCEGAWALTWWDKRDETMNFLRNKERPLWMVRSKDDDQMFWASEKWMLEVALDRAEIKTGEYHYALENMHYVVPVDNLGAMGKPIVTHKPCTYVHPVYQHQHHKGFQSGVGATTTKGATSTSTPSSTTLTLVEKKSDAVPSSSNTKPSYCQSKGVRLELTCLAQDSNGASYIDCIDIDNEKLDVRIYYKKGDVITSQTGQGILVTADIKDLRIHRTEGTYYKVARETVKKLEKKVVEAAKEVEVDHPPLYITHKNKLFTRFEFETEYGCCANCSGYVDPDQPYKFAMNGEAICNSCCSDPETMKYINVLH